ncbi:hypothetical protein SDC9_81059 [bioreactor metagenome]|uniref:Uncharacterized protein n=1 Tax=bioreactor metagenome TaxID=1076179 RepID=A0A644Z0X0_9ZZZZ
MLSTVDCKYRTGVVDRNVRLRSQTHVDRIYQCLCLRVQAIGLAGCDGKDASVAAHSQSIDVTGIGSAHLPFREGSILRELEVGVVAIEHCRLSVQATADCRHGVRKRGGEYRDNSRRGDLIDDLRVVVDRVGIPRGV